MVTKIITAKELQAMAREIGELLLQHFRTEAGQVEMDVEQQDNSIRVSIQATSQTGAPLFGVQTELFSTWLESPTGLNQKVILYKA
jgi:hypothetical protein